MPKGRTWGVFELGVLAAGGLCALLGAGLRNRGGRGPSAEHGSTGRRDSLLMPCRQETGHGPLCGHVCQLPATCWATQGARAAAADSAIWGRCFGKVLHSLHPVPWQPVLLQVLWRKLGPGVEGRRRAWPIPGSGPLPGVWAMETGKEMLSDTVGLARHPWPVPALTGGGGGETGQPAPGGTAPGSHRPLSCRLRGRGGWQPFRGAS